ncbi:MAG: DUF134 domain-containing protein [Methanobacteriaceae archaeon]|nr:DUF134 domain-containing protein [Methanobacteriaceae archaeon]
MPRPRRFRRILEEPQIRCFKPDKKIEGFPEPIKITIDEFEALRLRDYHDIQQKRSAEIMGISQPTFHRTLTSARKKISKALIEGKTIIIVGEDHITDKMRYKCNICDFEWLSPEKEYEKCPDCQSESIIIVEDEETAKTEPSLLLRRSFGGRGLGAGPPRVCKCPNCGYESPKTRNVPCKNTKCPQCETPLCGSDS